MSGTGATDLGIAGDFDLGSVIQIVARTDAVGPGDVGDRHVADELPKLPNRKGDSSNLQLRAAAARS